MTKFLDLDAVTAKAEFTVKLNGTEHKLKIASVETFIQNQKEIEKLSLAATAAEELEVVIGIIKRAFPTMPEKEIRGLNLIQLEAIKDFALSANGEKVEKVEPAEGETAAEGNG
ncbi:hypothetical protein [Mesorhizobium sp.]|uniref:hypothetical protein n=1 Tax=Mesorhizobium sp. TaxID=1871066 RepID=UPI000FE49DD2|nr:hypothetical protein [Mesorhizobium sp.]RWI35426.1 MAG: hypothetical protein EOR14_28400 [Mesorhizobium sp.]RWJ66405.1 MAG: hypothetical protein EOR34_28735 [Mesorhizobium sp.]